MIQDFWKSPTFINPFLNNILRLTLYNSIWEVSVTATSLSVGLRVNKAAQKHRAGRGYSANSHYFLSAHHRPRPFSDPWTAHYGYYSIIDLITFLMVDTGKIWQHRFLLQPLFHQPSGVSWYAACADKLQNVSLLRAWHLYPSIIAPHANELRAELISCTGWNLLLPHLYSSCHPFFSQQSFHRNPKIGRVHLSQDWKSSVWKTVL